MAITLGVMFQMDRMPTGGVPSAAAKTQVIDVQPIPVVQDQKQMPESARRSPLVMVEVQKTAPLMETYTNQGGSKMPGQTGIKLDIFA